MRDGEIGKNRECERVDGLKNREIEGKKYREGERGEVREKKGRNRERGRRIPAERARDGEASSEGWG